MEEILQKILKEGSSEKYAHICVKAHKALEYLESSPCGGPAEKYREIVLDVVRPALESGNSRLVALGVSCLQRVVRDDRFHSRQVSADKQVNLDEESWMTVQVLAAVHPINTLTDEHQQEILKVLLTLSCTKDWKLNGRIVVQIISLCLDAYNKGVAGVKAASQATTSQTLVEYGKYLGESNLDCEEEDRRQNDAITVCQFLCAKLDEGVKEIKMGNKTEIGLVLHSLLILVRSMPPSLAGNVYFSKFLWQRFNPTFLVYLGLPESAGFTAKSWMPKKRFKLDPKNIQLLYTISVELARVIGGQSGLRPVLESIFHRMLTCQGKGVSVEALKSLKENLLSKEDRIRNLVLASYTSDDVTHDERQFDSMAIFKLIADALENLGHGDGPRDITRQILVLESFGSLLDSLEKIVDNECSDIDDEIVNKIFNEFPYLELADYEGPVRYNYRERLPSHFVDVIENFEKQSKENSDETQNEGEEKEEIENKENVEDENKEIENEIETKENESEKKDEMKEDNADNDETKCKEANEANECEKETETKAEAEEEENNEDETEGENDETKMKSEESSYQVENYSTKTEKPILSKTSNDDEKEIELTANAEDDSSSASEDTEGPEEGFDNDEDTVSKLNDLSKSDANEFDDDEDTLEHRQSKLPQKLMSNSELAMGMEEEEHLERENAQIFLKCLKDELKYLTSARGTIEIDQRLQEFASKYCHEYSSLSSFNPSRTKLILNADGVYITSYATLHLNIKLASLRAYSTENEEDLNQRKALTTRDQFVDSILSCGLLIFLSPIWLDEIYSTVREIDVFGFGIGGSSGSLPTAGLKNVLSDLDGFGSTSRGARLLSDFRRLGPQQNKSNDKSARNRQARERLSRRILTTIWSSLISYLNSTLKTENGSSLNQNVPSHLFAAKLTRQSGPECQLNEVGIRCLLTAARLCSRLELHSRVGEVLSPLSQLLCSATAAGANRKAGFSASTAVSLSSVLAMEVVMEEALEFGSQAEDCWKHIMRLATFLISANNVCVTDNGSKAKKEIHVTSSHQQQPKNVLTHRDLHDDDDDDDDDLNLDTMANYSSSTAMSMPLFLMGGIPMMGGAGSQDRKTVREVLGLGNPENPVSSAPTNHQVLTNEQFGACVRTINSQIERFFEESASKLDMDALLGFLRELCFCSHRELLTITSSTRTAQRSGPGLRGHNLKWTKRHKRRSAVASEANLDALLLHRICDVMLKAIKTGRPLVHLIKAWAIVGPHLIEASSHPLFDIAKRSVENIHGIVTSFMQNTSELIYFHFNEALFKPFEHLVRLEICDQAIQDQIVASICEFVESNGVDIRSGWRPLFGALKHITFSDSILDEIIPVGVNNNNNNNANSSNPTSPSHTAAEPKETRAVLDVFDAFLSIESPHVFANAALDCIGCLVRHIRGSEERRQLEEIVEIDNNLMNHQGSIHLGRACLTYLLHCHEILMRISRMPDRPVFGGTHRIHASSDEKPATVDPTIPYMKVVSFDVATDTLPDLPFTFEALQTNITSESNVLLRDNAHGLFRLWFILVDGLCSCVSICAKGYQSSAIESLFAILSSFQQQEDDDGSDAENLAEFGLFLTNHVLLPMLQNWLRRCGHSVHEWSVSASSFKQCMGKTTELVMAWFSSLPTSSSTTTTTIATTNVEESRTLVLKQLVILLVECTVVPVESIARLGCSCFRHVIACGSNNFNEEIWNIVCLALCRATQVTLYPLHQLMSPFERGSTNFYGDVADVKVAARKDSNRKENHRLQQLAQQVLLLDQQRGDVPKMPANPDAEERSFLFLLHPPSQFDPTKGSGTPLRVALRSLITGLTANQLILQIIGKVLLQGTQFSIPGLSNVLYEGDSTNQKKSETLPGHLSVLNSHQVNILISALRCTYEVAMEFDSRPGLKFLLQKVTQLDNAANLYKTAGAAWCIATSTLFHLSLAKIAKDPQVLKLMREKMKNRIKDRSTCGNAITSKEINGATSQEICSTEILIELHDQIVDIVETYADIVADKDGQRARLDTMVRQKLYFLSIDPPPPEVDSPVFAEPTADNKPFSFADFAKSQPISCRTISSSQLSDPDGGSVSDSPIRSRCKIRSDKSVEDEDEDEEVFSMTTQTEKDSLVSEFRHRKGKRVLPFSTSSMGDSKSPSSAVDRRKNPFSFNRPVTSNVSSDPDIAAQQKKSLMADSEAQTKVWTDLALTPVQLSMQLSDEQLRSFLPVIFPGLKLLMIHAEGSNLKVRLAELMQRIAGLYEFSFDVDNVVSN